MRANQIQQLGNYHFLGKTLGKGHFGFVELAIHSLTNIKVAVKITEIHGDKAAIVRRNCHREFATLRKLNHPCIVKLHETLRTKNVYYLVMEYVDGGDLLNFVRDKTEGKLDEEDARWYFEQIVSAIDYLHQRRIVHRDLKMENILVHGADKRMVKIIDFGLSNIFSKGEFLSTKCGSPEYAAPELFRKDCSYGTEVDIWSMGIILYGMLIGALPFRNANYGKLVCLISKGLTSAHQQKMKHLNADCVVLLSNILQPDSSRRYTMQNIIANPWLCSGRNRLAVFKSPDVDRTTKQKLIKATADIMEVSRTDVSLAVDARQCDSVYAVYSILLQEELKQNKHNATKGVSSVVICDHSNATRLANEITRKRRRMNEHGTNFSRNILQKHRIRSTQAKRHRAMKTKVQNYERRAFSNGASCVIGRSIGKPVMKQTLTIKEVNNNTVEKVVENEDNKYNGLPKITSEEQVTIDIGREETVDQRNVENLAAINSSNSDCLHGKSSTCIHTSNEQNVLKNKNENDETESELHLNENDPLWSQDNSLVRQCNHDSNEDTLFNESSCDLLDGIAGHVSTMVDEITESPVATPSLAASSISDILSLIANEQCHNGPVWMDVDNSVCTSEYSDLQSGLQDDKRDGATCVTLQVIDVKKKPHVQQKCLERTRFKSSEKKGSTFSSIPTKQTVNPSKDLEEAIEERLKPCLKNSAASLRQRPCTANSKVSRKSTESKSDACIPTKLPPRPQTVASAQPRRAGLKANRNNTSRSAKDKSLKASFRAWRAIRKNSPGPKVDSWMKPKDSSFEISGTKIHVKGSSEEDSKKNIETQQHGTIFVPNRIPIQSSATNGSSQNKETSSINLVVGTGCFKKETESEKQADEISMMNDTRELPDSNVEMATDFVTSWLSKLDIDQKQAEKPHESMDSFQNEVNNCEECRNAISRNLSQKSSAVSKAVECKGKKEVRFSASDIQKKTNDRSSRTHISSALNIEAKWNAVEKLICAGQKINAWTREQIVENGPLSQVQNIKPEAKAEPILVPSGTISVNPSIVVPNPSNVTLRSGDEFDGAGSREGTPVKKCFQNSSVVPTEDCHDQTLRMEDLTSLRTATKNEYWNQTTSSKLRKDKLVVGSKDWMEAHLTAVLDKAKTTRDFCQKGLL